MVPLIHHRIIHHNDCFWCLHHQSTLIPPAKGNKPNERETCDQDGHPIPQPFGLGQRYCDAYRQKNCPCERCNPIIVTSGTGILEDQMVNAIDKTGEVC